MFSGARLSLALLGTAGILSGSCFMGFGLWFAPGWANDWPFGLDCKVVWPAGLSCVVFLTVLALAALQRCLHDMAAPPNRVRSRRWPWGSLAVSAAVAMIAFLGLRTQAVAIWP